MLLIVVLCGLAILFAYEIRHRMTNDRINFLENEAHRLNEEVKKIHEELKKKQDVEIKKGFKFPFLP